MGSTDESSDQDTTNISFAKTSRTIPLSFPDVDLPSEEEPDLMNALEERSSQHAGGANIAVIGQLEPREKIAFPNLEDENEVRSLIEEGERLDGEDPFGILKEQEQEAAGFAADPVSAEVSPV